MRLDQLDPDDRADATIRMSLVLDGTAPITPRDPADALAYVLHVIRTKPTTDAPRSWEP